MTRVLIVSYDLGSPGQNYERILQLIKAYDSWAKLGGSAYLIRTEASPVQVRDNLKTALDVNDKLYVGAASEPAAWTGMPEDVSKWIQANLP